MLKRKVGILCMALGALLFLGSVLLSVNNQRENHSAGQSSAEVLPDLIEQIRENMDATLPASDLLPELQKPVELLTEEEKKMTEVMIDGIPYIGYLSIPKLELELPIIGTWDYTRLNVAPCRFTGTVLGEDLVLMAHNYAKHFGKISRLELGDTVVFTDMDGEQILYEVVGEDILGPDAVEEMTSGDFDLTLFTCTYGGESRITVYCNRAETAQ